MKASLYPTALQTIFRQRILNWAFALSLTVGTLISATTFAASADTTEVPFIQALANAHQVANLNTGWKVYVSQGESMLPQISQDSLLLVARTEFNQLKEGMLVVYRDSAGDLVSHRLIARTSDGWVAKGLSNYREDPGLVTRDNLQGVVFGTMRYQAGSDKLMALEATQRPTVAYAKKY